MKLQGKAKLLRIYTGDSDKVNGKCLYECIVEEARRCELAGATVYRGIMSFGASHSIHTMRIFALSGDLPVVIEIIDEEAKIRSFIPLAEELMDKSKKGGLIFVEDVEVIRYVKGEKYKL